jgi:5-aminolevulinate synthase
MMISSPDGSTKDIATYEDFFLQQLADLKREGRYRIFTELERRAGRFPRATRYLEQARDEVIVWCSNDYLGMGQHQKVLTAMHEAIERCGAGAGGTQIGRASCRERVLSCV